MYTYNAPAKAAKAAIPGRLPQRRPQRGGDFVLPNIPILDSPEWSDEENDINLRRTPPRAKAEAGTSAPYSDDDRRVFSPAMRVHPMVGIVPPFFGNQIAPPSDRLNLRAGYEATHISHNRNRKSGDGGARLHRRAPGAGDTGGNASLRNGCAVRNEHETFNADARGRWLDDGDTEEKSDSPPQLSIGSFTAVRGGSRFFVPGGRRFVAPAHHFSDESDESSHSARSGNSNSSSDTDSTSVFRQQSPSLALSPRGPTEVGVLLGGCESPQRPSVPPESSAVSPSTVVTRLPQQPSLLAARVAGRTGPRTAEAVSAAPSIFCTLFNEDDGSDYIAAFRGDSTSASHGNGPSPPSMTASGATAPPANGSASVFSPYSYGRCTEVSNGMATVTHGSWANQPITTAGGDGELGQDPFTYRNQGSFFIAVGEGVHETRLFPTSTHSPNATMLVATDASSTHTIGASQASSCAAEPAHQLHDVPHSSNSNRDAQRGSALPVSRPPASPEKTSRQRSCVYGVLADYMLFPQRYAGVMAPSLATGRTTPANNRVVGDGMYQRDTQRSDEESQMHVWRTRVLKSVSSRPCIMHPSVVVEDSRDSEGSFYSSMLLKKATPLSSTSPAESTPPSNAKSNTERLYFRSRIAPLGHGTAAFAAPAGSALASSQTLAVSERSCTSRTDAMAFSVEMPYGGDIDDTDTAANRDGDGVGDSSAGPSAVVMEGDEYDLMTWAFGSPLRTRLASAVSFDASGGDVGAANESAAVAGGVAGHAATKAALLPMAPQPSSTTHARRTANNVRPRLSVSPNTAVTIVETARLLTPATHHDTPSTSTTRGLPLSQLSSSTPPHLVMTMPAEATESSRQRSSSTMPLRSTATCNIVPVTARIVARGSPAATLPPWGVIGDPSSGFAPGSLAAVPSHALSQNVESFHSFPRNLAVSGAPGGEDCTNERVPVSPLPNMPSPIDTEGQMMGTDQRCPSSISGSSCIETPVCLPFRPSPPPPQPGQRQRCGEAAPPFVIPSFSSSTETAATLASKDSTGGKGSPLATAEDECELLLIDMGAPNASVGGAGGFVTANGYPTLSAQTQLVPVNVAPIASGRFVDEGLRERGLVHRNGHCSHSATPAGAEEVQSPRKRYPSSHHRRQRSLPERERRRRSCSHDLSERLADRTLSSVPKERVGSHHQDSHHRLIPSFLAAKQISPTLHTDSSSPSLPRSTLPRMAILTALDSRGCGARHNSVRRTSQTRTPGSSSRTLRRLKRLAKCLGL